MRVSSCLAWSAAVLLGSSGIVSADMQGTGESGGWE